MTIRKNSRIGKPSAGSKKVAFGENQTYKKKYFSYSRGGGGITYRIFSHRYPEDYEFNEGKIIQGLKISFSGGLIDPYFPADGCDGETVVARVRDSQNQTVCNIYSFGGEDLYSLNLEYDTNDIGPWELVVYDNARPARNINGYIIIKS